MPQDLGFCPKKARCQLYQKRKKFHFLRDTWENTDNLYTAIFVITAQYYCFVTIVFCALTSNLYAVMMRNEARGLACGILCGGRSRPRMGLWNRPGMIRPAVCGCGRPAERERSCFSTFSGIFTVFVVSGLRAAGSDGYRAVMQPKFIRRFSV